MHKKRHYNIGGGVGGLSTARSQVDEVKNLSSMLRNRAKDVGRRMSSGLGSGMANGDAISGYQAEDRRIRLPYQRPGGPPGAGIHDSGIDIDIGGGGIHQIANTPKDLANFLKLLVLPDEQGHLPSGLPIDEVRESLGEVHLPHERFREILSGIGGRAHRMAREGPSAAMTALVGKPILDRIGIAVEDRLRPAARRAWGKGAEVFEPLEDKLIRGVTGLLGPRDKQSSVYESIAMGLGRAEGGSIPGYQAGGPTKFGLTSSSGFPPPYKLPRSLRLKYALQDAARGIGSLFKGMNRLTPKSGPLGLLQMLLSPTETGPGTHEEFEEYEQRIRERNEERDQEFDFDHGEIPGIRYTGTGNELGPLSLYGGGVIPGYQAGGGWGQTEATPPGSAPGITPPPTPPGGGAQAVPPPPGGTGGGGWGGPQAVPPPPGGAQPLGGPPSAPPGAGWNTAEPLKSGLAAASSGYASGVQPLAGGSWSQPAQTLGGPPPAMDTSAGIPWIGPGPRPADYDPQQAARDREQSMAHARAEGQLRDRERKTMEEMVAKGWKPQLGGPGGLWRNKNLAALQQQQQQLTTSPQQQQQMQERLAAMQQQAATPGAQYYNPTQSGPGYQARPLPEDYGAPARYSGFGAPGQMTVRQEHLAPEIAAPMADITQSIMDIGTTPYEQYQGPRLAGFSPDEAAAQAAFGAYGRGQGPMGTRQAAGTLGEVGRGLGSMTGRAEAGALDPYMSQYMEGVVDPQLSKLQEFSRQQGEELKSQAAAATGGVGGLREGVVRRGQLQDVRQQAADIIGQGQQRAFESAQQAFGQAHAERLGQLGALSGVAGQQRGLGQQQQQQQLERLQQMQQAGADQRQLQQAGLDIGWEEFQRRQQYPQRQTSWMAQQMAALPYGSTVSEGVYTPQGGAVSTAIGSGLAGIGAAEQYRQQQEEARRRRAETEKLERENEQARRDAIYVPPAPDPIKAPADPTLTPVTPYPTTTPPIAPPPGYENPYQRTKRRRHR